MKKKKLPAVLTIAGSDCSGGAGIQADLKTILAHRMYGMSVITAVTAQNTCGVIDLQEIAPSMVKSQLKAVFTDIHPDGIKIGMLGSGKTVEAVVQLLREYRPLNIVVDPVMKSTSGYSLLSSKARKEMEEGLFPLVSLITPNIPEAEILSGITIQEKMDMEIAAEVLWKRYRIPVLVKGGHLKDRADDLLYLGESLWYPGRHLPSKNTHGTGCTLSTAIACSLAAGQTLKGAVTEAKKYISGAMNPGLDLGKGNGPLHHGWEM